MYYRDFQTMRLGWNILVAVLFSCDPYILYASALSSELIVASVYTILFLVIYGLKISLV